MSIKRFIALSLVAAIMATIAPQAPVLADGAASTRNIILLSGAAALLIINHNKHVHEKYAEDAAAEASLASQRNDAQAAYASEKKAYTNEVALVGDLQREVAYQHSVIQTQDKQIAAINATPSGVHQTAAFAAPTTLVKPTPVGGSTQVAVTSYGWGNI